MTLCSLTRAAASRASRASARDARTSSATNACSAGCVFLPTACDLTPSLSSTPVCGTPLTYARVTISPPSKSRSDPDAQPTCLPNASHEILNVPSGADGSDATSPALSRVSESDGGKNTTRVVSVAAANAALPRCALTPQNGTLNKATPGVGPLNAPTVHAPVNADHVAAKPSSATASPRAAPSGGMTISSAPRAPRRARMRLPEGALTGFIAAYHAGGAGMPVTPEPRRVDATTPGGNCGNPGGGAGDVAAKNAVDRRTEAATAAQKVGKAPFAPFKKPRPPPRFSLTSFASFASPSFVPFASSFRRRRAAALASRASRGGGAARLVHPSGVCVGCRVSQASTSLRFVQFVKRFAFFRRAFVRGSRRSRRSRQNVSMASRSYVLPDPATNTGSRNMSLVMGQVRSSGSSACRLELDSKDVSLTSSDEPRTNSG